MSFFIDLINQYKTKNWDLISIKFHECETDFEFAVVIFGLGIGIGASKT